MLVKFSTVDEAAMQSAREIPTQILCIIAAPLQRSIVAAALDALGQSDAQAMTQLAQFLPIVRRVTRTSAEAAALMVRLAATMQVLEDERWPLWCRRFSSMAPDAQRHLHAVIADLIAGLPLDAKLRFVPGDFYAGLLARSRAAGRS